MDVVYATGTGRVGVGVGGGGVVRKGTHWPADDPVVLEHPDMFSTDARYGLQFSVEPAGYRDGMPGPGPVEQATAGPGERRVTRRAS